MSHPSIENIGIRQEAWGLTRKHLWKLLGMMLTEFAISYAVIMVGVFLLFLTTDISLNAMENDMSVGFSPIWVIGCFVLIAVTMLVMGGLGLGVISAMLSLCRRDENVPVRRVFNRMGSCLKALGLGCWVHFKTMLWMLPGYAVMNAALFFDARNGQSAASGSDAASASPLLLVGMILAFALVIPAVYRYMMSIFILADEPSTGVFECVRRSKAMMKGHKWQCFKLTIPLFLIAYAVMVGVVIVMAILTVSLGKVSEMAASLLGFGMFIVMLMVFVSCVLMCFCLFYLNRRAELDASAVQIEPLPDQI